MKHVLALSLVGAAATLSSASAQTDTFDGGSNPRGWTFGVVPPDVIESSGGNPAGWLHNSQVDNFTAIVRNDPSVASHFIGNLRANQVTRIGVDAITVDATFGAAGREFSILLRDTKGTSEVDDDDYAYFVGSLVPQVGQGWSSYVFDIPSQSTAAVPPGWSGGWVGDGEAFRPGVSWVDVIESVDQVEFWWMNPSFFAIFQQWDVGIDNVFVETAQVGDTFCTPSVPNSSGAPATIAATGSAVASVNDLTLLAQDLPAGTFGYFLNSQVSGSSTPPSSMGTLCLGGAIGRFDASIWNSGASGSASLTLDLTALPTPGGFVSAQAGETWMFQGWFRDANPTLTSNFTDGVSVTLR